MTSDSYIKIMTWHNSPLKTNKTSISVEIGKKILTLQKNATACYDRAQILSIYNKTAMMENIKNSVIKSLVT